MSGPKSLGKSTMPAEAKAQALLRASELVEEGLE